MPVLPDTRAIPDDVKQFLRSILISPKGVKQSRIERDYRELVGEPLPWRSLGFKSIFEFLTSVPDVAKLEWREKDEDNRVFAVLDKNSFSSLHAKRMAERGFGYGSQPLSPEEIIAWKARKNKTSLDSMQSKSNSKQSPVMMKVNGNQSSAPNKLGDQLLENGKIIVDKEGTISITFVNDDLSSESDISSSFDMSEYEDKMTCNLEGLYSLYVQVTADSPSQVYKNEVEFESILRKHFMLPECNIVKLKIISGSKMAFLRFKTKFEAAYTLDKKHNTEFMGLKFHVSPAKERQAHNGTVKQTPNTSSLLHAQNVMPPSNRTELFKAPSSGVGLLGSCPAANFVAHFQQAAIAKTLRSEPINLQMPIKVKCGPINIPPQHVSQQNIHSQHISPKSPTNETKTTTKISSMKKRDHHNDVADSNTNSQVATDVLFGRSCGKEFCLNYMAMDKFFRTSCGEKPKSAADFPNRLKLLITFSVDAFKFWIQDAINEDECIQLSQSLRQEIVERNRRTNYFPRSYDLGAAQYSEDKIWYRCWVIESDKERERIKVFFCDYGNTEIVSKELFTHIDKKFWKLPPQAIPVKLHGLECPANVENHNLIEGAEFLEKHCYGKIIEAEIVKTNTNSEAHVIEIANVKVPGLAPKTLEDALIEGKYLVRKEMSQMAVKTKEETLFKKDSKEDNLQQRIQKKSSFRATNSLFKYVAENLIKVQLLAVESPNLFYWRAQDSDHQLIELKRKLASSALKDKAEIVIGELACLREENENIRVRILDLACNFMYSKQVLVFDIDSGTKMWAEADNLYALESEFRRIHEIVKIAALAGIEAHNRVTDATSMLRLRINKESLMNVLNEDSHGKFYVELFSEETSNSINCEMIQRGLAKITASGPHIHNDDSETSKSKSKGPRNLSTSSDGAPVLSVERDSPFVLPNKKLSVKNQRKENQSCNMKMKTSSANSNSNQFYGTRNAGPNNAQKHCKKYTPRRKFSNKSRTSSESSENCYSDEPGPMRLKRESKPSSAPHYKSDGEQRNPERKRNGAIGNQKLLNGPSSPNNSLNATNVKQQDKETISAAVTSDNRVSQQPDALVVSCTPKFRPHTPPLPPLVDIESPENEPSPSYNLLLFVKTIAKENGLQELVQFNSNGTLNREAINSKMKRWESHKIVLQKHRDNLREILCLTEDKSHPQVIKSKKKRLELHVRSMESEKQLIELTNDLEGLRIEYESLLDP